MTIETLRKKATWELKAMIKALSQPISSFLNTDEDNERLENAKKVLKERRNKQPLATCKKHNATNISISIWQGTGDNLQAKKSTKKAQAKAQATRGEKLLTSSKRL